MKRICSEKGCYEVHVARGYCAKHYQRYFVLGYEEGVRYCSVSGCRNKYHGDGLCKMHYTRKRKYGTPIVSEIKEIKSSIRKEERKNRKCSVDGCDRNHHAKGLCRRHYENKKYQENKKHTE